MWVRQPHFRRESIMNQNRSPLLFAAALAMAVSTIVSTAQAELFRVRARAADELIAPADGPLLIAPGAAYRHEVASPVAPAIASPVWPAAAPALCCKQPCLKYRDHIGRRSCFASEPRVNMLLEAKSPCGCCVVEIPVCIPACCLDAPCVTGRDGLFGREIVNYVWKCGFRVKVVFDRHGDAVVHYLD